jgi:hypothetical protein
MESRLYRCVTEGTARRVAADLLEQTEEGILWENIVFRGGYAMEAVSLDGFDESWYGVQGDGESSALLLRKGKTVALVLAPVDLREEEALSVIRSLLFGA